MWTEQGVRTTLPDVEVLIGKQIRRGRVIGRMNPWATVTVDNQGTLHRGNTSWHYWHFSWSPSPAVSTRARR